MFGRAPKQGVEALFTPQHQDMFAENQALVRETMRAHGIDQGNAVAIGGAGMALQGIDTFVPLSQESRFDVDAFLEPVTFDNLLQQPDAYGRPESNPSEVHFPATGSTLKVDGLKTPAAEHLSHFQARTFADLRAQATVVGEGTLALSPNLIASGKLRRGDAKDMAGIIQGHAVAWHENRPIITDEVWQWKVISACNGLKRRAQVNRAARRSLPGWLGGLVSSGFDHPAFTSLNPSMETAGRVA